MGRVLVHRQLTDGQVRTAGYVYNLFGALVEKRYPSGRVEQNVLDSSGDLAQVHSEANQMASLLTCASDFSYIVECLRLKMITMESFSPIDFADLKHHNAKAKLALAS